MDKYKELIGTFRIESDMKRIDAAECPKYDRWVDVKAGEYPVYIYRTDEIGRVGMAYVTFDDMSEIWYGFQLATSEHFTPADGWKVNRWTFKSDWDGHDIETGEIVRKEQSNEGMESRMENESRHMAVHRVPHQGRYVGRGQ